MFQSSRVFFSFWILALALLCSGAAGLIYESAWTRLLHRVFGVSDLAVASVLALFFLGLAMGNALALRFVERIRRPAQTYALLEGVIALLALLSLFLIPGIGSLYGLVGAGKGFWELSAWRLFLAALVLLPPTIAMGATLPVLSLLTPPRAWSGLLTLIYAVNTLGAVIGAWASGFLLLPHLGTRASIGIGAALSLLAALLVGVGFRDKAAPPSVEEELPSTSGHNLPLSTVALLSALSGFCTLGSEVLWTRALRIVVHGTIPAFSAMLMQYLLGIAVGGWLAERWSRRLTPPLLFASLQSAMVLLIPLAMRLLPFLQRLVPLLAHREDTVPHETWVIVLLAFILLFPLALVLGTGLPLTWAMVDQRAKAGTASSLLLATNTLGALFGALLVGLWAIPTLGTEASLLGIALLHALGAGVALKFAIHRRLFRALVIALPLALWTIALWMQPTMHLRFLLSAQTDVLRALVKGPDESWNQQVVFLREGRNTTVTILRHEGGLGLYNDGRPESGFAVGHPGFGPELVLLGALPGLLAEERKQALIVGLGAGHTATLALATGFERLLVVELEEAVVEAARLLHQARARPFPLDDPRAQLIVDDARNILAMMPSRSLDAVISQPSHPWLAGSSALYTIEFFREVDRVLRDGGVFGLWLNLFRTRLSHIRTVLRTLIAVFPHVRGFVVERSSLVLMASRTARPFGEAQASLIAQAEARGPFFAPYGLDRPLALLARQELDTQAVRALAQDGPIITDDLPYLEFELARLSNQDFVTLG
ncbi:MAG: MFS transporter, partial [Sandaracinaceae bacterium]|nr:MFS transporter [Sandaracinaceae bacterium]